MNIKLLSIISILFISFLAIGVTFAADTTNQITVNDTTYNSYFDDNGYIKETVSENSTLNIENLTSKDMIINKSNIAICGDNLSTQKNVKIILGDDNDVYTNLNISNLNIINDNKTEAIIVNEGVTNSIINNNKVTINYNGTTDSIGGIIIYGYTENITIINNIIKINGNGGYLYGIDLSSYKKDWTKGYANSVNYNIENNQVSILGTPTMVGAIYLDELINGTVKNNTININTSQNCENYGIAISYSFANKESENITIANNSIKMSGTKTNYGIENFKGNKIQIINNNIEIDSKAGCFAIASTGNNTLIDENTLKTKFGSIENITTYDSFGVGNQTIFIKNSHDVNITNNNIITENSNWLKNETNTNLKLENNTLYDGKISLKTEDISLTYKNGTNFTSLLLDSSLKPIVNEEIIFKITGKNYTRVTNENGIASIAINLESGIYSIETYYNGKYGKTSAINNITVLTSIKGNDIEKLFKNGTQYSAIFYSKNGEALKNKEVQFNINGVWYKRTTNNEGISSLNINLNSGIYIITNVNLETTEENSNIIKVLSTINGTDIEKICRNKTQYSAIFYGKNGETLKNKEVQFNINGVLYRRTTNNEGIASLNINLNANTYIITNINPETGEENSNTIKVISSIKGEDLTKTYGDKTPYKSMFYNLDGTLLANTNVTFNINGVMYTRSTDNNGLAMLNINLNKGNYIITSINPVNNELQSNKVVIQ